MAAPAADQAPLGVDLLSKKLVPSACHEPLGVEFFSQQGAHPERLTNWPKSQLPLRLFEVVGNPISLGNTLAEEVYGFQHISTQRTIDFTKHLREKML